MEIKRVHFIGLGAIGLKYAARIHDADPSLVRVIADDARIAQFRATPPTVNGKPYDFEFVRPDLPGEPADVIFVAVKWRHLERALADMRGFVGKRTSIISLMNGIASEEVIAREFGRERVIYANVYMDAVRSGNAVTWRDIGRIVFGEENNAVVSARVKSIETLFDKAHIPSNVPADMLGAHWAKFMLNVGINQASAVLRAPYGTFQTNRYARELMVSAAQEVVEISQHAGVGLDQSDIDRFLAIIDSLDPAGKTSMLQDVEGNRETEVDIFAGTVVDLGERYDVPTPVNRTLLTIIRAIDADDRRDR
ncbi:ketopantoate reductase family protein [Paraburkholderia dinghuensis]|uniref:2-dehydropantoate 2-reductase n=1 Tax=Paraburkholderia dinghuensis TaxID=2305225 RepID=A0A3N6NYU7_9BURK|nr:ketopantoate reductase family protein [Paraburkholderia dinghuensis]RQH06073.1 ketopantoate reductase family protein [Paraburkholderia dinghuensis]